MVGPRAVHIDFNPGPALGAFTERFACLQVEVAVLDVRRRTEVVLDPIWDMVSAEVQSGTWRWPE